MPRPRCSARAPPSVAVSNVRRSIRLVSHAVSGEPMHSTIAPKVISRPASRIVTPRPDRQFAQHARRRQHRAAGDDISEHQGGGSEAAMNVAVGRRIFHANACIPDRRERKGRDTDYFRDRSLAAMSWPFEAARQRLRRIAVVSPDDDIGAQHRDGMVEQFQRIARLGQSEPRAQQRPKLLDLGIVAERVLLEVVDAGRATPRASRTDRRRRKRRMSCQ